MEAFLRGLLARLLGETCTFRVSTFQGKSDLLNKLEARLRGYAAWLPENHRVEDAARQAGLSTRSSTRSTSWQVVNRIVIQELESWYFSDWNAVRAAYPRVSGRVIRNKRYREPDALDKEDFERVLQTYGYFKTGLRKIEAGRLLGTLMERERSTSRSFNRFCEAILEAVT